MTQTFRELVLRKAGGDPKFWGHLCQASGCMDPWRPVSSGSGHWNSDQGITMAQAGIILPVSCHVFWRLPASPHAT